MATAALAATAVPFTPSATSAAVEIALIKQRQRDRVASLPKSEVQEYQESKQTCIPPSRMYNVLSARTSTTFTHFTLTHAFAHLAHFARFVGFARLNPHQPQSLTLSTRTAAGRSRRRS